MEIIKRRNYYVDLFRGIAFILMMIDHLLYNLTNLFNSYWQDLFPEKHYLNLIVKIAKSYRSSSYSFNIRLLFIAFIFLFISGVSSIFSKNNYKRGLRLLLISLALSTFTFVLSLIIQDKSIIIYFGILHCLSISMLLTPLFRKVDPITLFIIAVAIILLGISFSTLPINNLSLIIFNIKPINFTTADYYPLLPYMGIYILGIVFSKWYFEIKQNPKLTKNYKNNIITYFGRNALIWYFLHQVILVVFLVLLTLINLLFI